MKAFYIPILLLILLLSYSCTSEIPELELKVVKSKQPSLNKLTYVIQAQEKNNLCSANSVEFVMKIVVSEESDIDPGKAFFTGEIFGTVPRGKTLEKKFIYRTEGRKIDLDNGVRLDEMGFGNTDCVENQF